MIVGPLIYSNSASSKTGWNIGNSSVDDVMGLMGAYSSAQSQQQYDLNHQLQQEVMDYNSAEARLNREFQERMSNSQYQRLVKDLKAAGLNPLLAYSSAQGSVPAGSMAATSSSSVGRGNDITNLVSAMVSSANNSRDMISDIVTSIIGGISKIISSTIGKK